MKRVTILMGAALALCACPISSVRTCQTTADCSPPGVCQDNVCVLNGSGGGTGGGGGGGGGGVGGGAGGSCAVSCAPWQRCAPTTDGGRCDSLGLSLQWEAPLADAPFQPSATIQLQVRVDGGAFTGSIPFRNAAGSAGTLTGGSGVFTGTTAAGLTDMTYTLTAGWQDGGPTATTTYRVDGTAPRLAAWWEGAPSRPSHWTAAGTEWRRDEAPHVRVCATEAINPTTVALQLGGAGTAMAAAAPASCTTAGVAACTGSLSTEVGCYTADLSQPTLAGLTGVFRLAATAQDLAGNPTAGAQDGGSVDVTRARWKVRFSGGTSGNGITAAPALDDNGILYGGTASNLFALTPNGDAPAGWTAAGVAVGAVQSVAWGQSAGNPYLYVAYNNGAGGVVDVRTAATGAALATTQTCGPAGQTFGGLALLDTGGGQRSAVGVLNAGTPGALCVVRPGTFNALLTPNPLDAGVDAFDLPAVPNPPNTAINLVAVTSGASTTISIPSSGAVLHKVVWNAGLTYAGNEVASGTPVPNATDFFMGLAPRDATGATFIAGSDNRLANVYLLGATKSALATTAAVGFPVVKDATVGALVGVAAGAAKGLRVVSLAAPPALGAQWNPVAKPGAFFSAAPVLGEGGWAYAINYGGALGVRPFPSLTGPGGWEVDVTAAPLSLGGVNFAGAPTLDCNRPLSGGPGAAGKPGVLYLVSTGGDVVSILVDSPKLDSAAVWPKYQRDAANSGNPGLGLALNPGCP